METTTLPTRPPVSTTPAAVEEQLQRLLASPLFSHSRRYPGFLSYVVEEALRGNGDHLKERSIGIDVFHRVPDYDLNVDPVVRVTAGEVRKRLAQYYYAADHQDELRIELKPGSYIPEFRFAPDRAQPVMQVPEASPIDEAEARPRTTHVDLQHPSDPQSESLYAPPAEALPQVLRGSRSIYVVAVFLSVMFLAIAVITIYRSRMPSAIDSFWQPVWNTNAPVLISVGSWESPAGTASDLSIGAHAKSSDPIALADTVTIAGMQQLLSEHAKKSQIQSSAQTTFADLQRGTTILISGFDNPWTMRLTDPLRFHFVARTPDVLTIEDRENPGRADWLIDTRTPYAQLTHDFAIVARFHDSTTEQLIVVAAGIGENGTLAAGQMLTSDQLLKAAEASPGFDKRRTNVEAVIETLVINGKSGPPRVVSLVTW